MRVGLCDGRSEGILVASSVGKGVGSSVGDDVGGCVDTIVVFRLEKNTE